MSPQPPLTIRRATLADAWSVTSVFIQSFGNDEMSRWIYGYPKIDSVEHQELLLCATRFRLPAIRRYLVSGMHHAFIVEDRHTRQPVGISIWDLVDPQTAISISMGRHTPARRIQSRSDRFWASLFLAYDRVLGLLPRFLWRLLQPQFSTWYERRSRWVAEVTRHMEDNIQPDDRRDGYWELSHLGVLSEYGGKGIASELLQWGLDQADAEDRAVYLSATSAGAPLYRRRGFETLSSALYFVDENLGGWKVAIMRRCRSSQRQKV